MVTYRGYNTVVLYDDETSYGSGSDPETVIKGKIQSVTINKNNTLQRTLGMGEGRNETFVGFGNFEGTWSMEYQIADFDFLRFGFGSMHGAGTTASPKYLQEEDLMDYDEGADNGLKSFGLIVNSLDIDSGDQEYLEGCIINTMSFELSIGEIMTVSLDGFFKNVTSSTDYIAEYTKDTTMPWIFAQGKFKWNNVAVARVQSATINVNNNFEPDVGRELGSRFVQAAEPGLRKYDWTITVKMTDTLATSMRDHFYGKENTPHDGAAVAEPDLYDLELELSEGTTSGDRNARILLGDGSINDISKPISLGENIVELTINGAAKKGKTDTTNRPIKWWTTT